MNSIDTGVRYVIVDKETEALDWDGELHKTVDECLDSLCAPLTPYVRTEGQVTDEKELWSNVYEIRSVLPAKAKR